MELSPKTYFPLIAEWDIYTSTHIHAHRLQVGCGESLDMQNSCAEIKIRAERRIGEFSKEMPKAQGKYQQTNHDEQSDKTRVLTDAGIKNYQRYEAIADIPEEEFEEMGIVGMSEMVDIVL